MPKTYGGTVTISKQLLDFAPRTFKDLDGKEATIEDVIQDGLREMLGWPPLYRWPDPLPPEPPLCDTIRQGCCADWPKPCSYHEGWLDGHEAKEYEDD